MATTILLANDGNDRLIVTTICTHHPFFHEAGFEYRTERKERTPSVWWNPTTWRGFRWRRSDEAEQPRDVSCTFNQGIVPSAFGATPQSSPGFFKLSCDYLPLRPHCVWVVEGGQTAPRPDPAADTDARNVRTIQLRFSYDEKAWALSQ